jgi:nucleotide-binding universal stress UspA family protein
MKKILLVINAQKPGSEALNFAVKIAASTPAKLAAIIIENIYFEYIPPIGLEAPSYYATVLPVTHTVTADKEQVIHLIEEACKTKGVSCEVITDNGDPIEQIVFESRFADLLVIDPQVTIIEGEEQLPSHFVKEVLAKAECPVLLSPEKFEDVEEIDFCYDGSASSVFAIKQFTYLMPQFRGTKVNVLEVNPRNKEEYKEADRKMMGWLRANYPSVCYHSLKGDTKGELFTYLFMTKKRLIVMGAYGRSMLSNFFKRSSADILIRTVDLPLFITHH